MWKYVCESVQGSSHLDRGQPCQDSCAVASFESDGDNLLILVCSDGAGSAAHAEAGSKVACETVVASITGTMQSGRSLTLADRAMVIEWLMQLRGTLSAEAARLETDVRELACTLLVAVVGKSSALFAQIGDGAIVTSDKDSYRPVFWPQAGEYPNVTNFVTDAEFEQSLLFQRSDGRIEELAIFSDGLERLALRYVDQTAHGPFFEPMFRSLRAAKNASDLSLGLREFLNSPRVNDRTDDDKTLILATRVGVLDDSVAAS